MTYRTINNPSFAGRRSYTFESLPHSLHTPRGNPTEVLKYQFVH